MNTFYITFTFFAILLIFILIMFFIEIPAPVKVITEVYNLEFK